MAFLGLHAPQHTLNIAAWHALYPHVFDGLVYLVIFTGIARVTVGRRFEGNGGKALTAAVGIALTVGAVTAARAYGLTLAGLAPMAWGLLLVVLSIACYDLLRQAHAPRVIAFAGGLLLTVATASAIGGPGGSLLDVLGLGYVLPVVLGIGALLLLVLLVLTPTALGLGVRGSRQRLPLGHDHEIASCLPHSESTTDWDSTDAEYSQHRVYSTHDVSSLLGAVERGEHSVLLLLRSLAQQLGQHGIDDSTFKHIDQIADAQRRIDRLHDALLEGLARSGWRSSPDRHSLDDGVSVLTKRSRQNREYFNELLRIAIAAAKTRNLPLLAEAVAKMMVTERDAVELCDRLERCIQRLEHAQRDRQKPVGGR